jgi:hypothetical protein
MRMRVGYDSLEVTTRNEHWIRYDPAEYAYGMTVRCSHFAGPKDTDGRAKASNMAWDTRIPELENADRDKWYKVGKEATTCAGYDLWRAKFGAAKHDSKTARNLERRRNKEQAKRIIKEDGDVPGEGAKHTSNKRRKLNVIPSEEFTDAVSPTSAYLERQPDPSDALTNDELKATFLTFTEPLSDVAYRRVGAMLQRSQSLAAPVPWDLLRDMRNRAPSWTRDQPRNIFSDPEYLDYIKKAELRRHSPSPVAVGKPGEAFAELQGKVYATLQQFAWVLQTYYRTKNTTEGPSHQ